jgi:asparagine synthase (glutamine-hydrolysing)
MNTVSAQNIALWLAWPSVLGEFHPAPLAVGPLGRSSAAPWPENDPRVTDVREPFRRSVRSCMADHETVAVSVSGGLDSLAVLIEAARIAAAEGRRILAAVTDMTDDAGRSTVPVVQRLIAATGGPRTIELHVSATDDMPTNRPVWRPHGPDLDALPLVNRRLAEQAADQGATVMLSGNGADEALGAVRYLLGGYARAAHFSALRSYWGDSIGTHREAYPAEALAAISPLLPKRWRAFLYVALEWPELCTQHEVPAIIPGHLRDRVSAWSTAWIRDLVRFHAAHHRTWAQAAAWDAIYPSSPLDGPGPIPLHHPFLTPVFLDAVKQLPIARRYDPALPYVYWRQKAQVIALLPDAVRGALPTAKATFRTTLSQCYQAEKTSGSTLIEAGVLSARQWRTERDPLLVSRVNVLEAWTAEALARGYRIVDEQPPLTV